MSIAAHTAAYVRAISDNRRLKAQVTARLATGKAWEQEEQLVVCMVDISGYSKLSASLTFLGKLESEIITKTVGGYLNKIIDVFELYSGDIVRFLGDALLVTFSPSHGEPLGAAVLRSLKCCLHVAICCKSVDVDMSLASSSTTAQRDNTDEKLNDPSASLQLHFAITAGKMSHVIIGDPAWRLDYCIQGDALRQLGVLLDNTGKGELGISADAVEELASEWRGAIQSLTAGTIAGHTLIKADGVNSLAAVCCKLEVTEISTIKSEEIAARFQKANNFGPIFDAATGIDDDDSFVRLFVNHSSLRRLDGLKAHLSSKGVGVKGGGEHDLASRGANPPSNVSLRHEATISEVVAEFRSVAAIFVSLVFPFKLDTVQVIILSFLKALKEHKGVFVQYSADDKGQTMLAVFGLPSFSHVNNSDQSVKCVKSFVEDMKRSLGGSLLTNHVAIAVTSGEILLTKLGNQYRSEIGLLGDVIVAAARLMGVAQHKEVVVIDEETNDKVKLTHTTSDLGLAHLKGRTKDTKIYGLELNGLESQGPAVATFGYQRERDAISERFDAWQKNGRRTLVVVEAASGLGKSTLGNFLTDLAKGHGIPVCLTQGSEIEQWRPFSGLQSILFFVFSKIPCVATAGAMTGLTTRRFIRSSSFSTVSGSRQSTIRQSLAHDRAGLGLGAAVLAFFQKAGVDVNLAPLLMMVSMSMAVSETPLTENMDPQAKINHLKSIVIKIITAFILEVDAVFIFDDAQWYDSQTLEVLMTLSRTCPKIAKLSKLTVRVKGIDPDIFAAILAKTAGSPLFLQMIIDVIFVKIGVDLVVNDAGVVVLRDESVHVDVILTDLSAAVLFQFDRLNSEFQLLLKMASVFGQYFNLRNVLELCNLANDEMACVEMIREADVYNFLNCELPPPSTSQQSRDGLTESDGIQCSFRHISIVNAIYESLSFEERIQVNKSVGLMIEGLLDDDNREVFLPTLEYHFSRTLEIEKIINYKEELGFTLAAKAQCVEGIRILESLVQYVSDADPQDLRRLSIPVTSTRKAWWYARLCGAYKDCRRYPKDKEYAIVALSYLPTATWPTTAEDMKRALRPEKWRAYITWFLYRGGKQKSNRKGQRRVGPDLNLEDQIMCEKWILKCMCDAAGLNHAYTDDEVCYVLLRYLTLRLRYNDDDLAWCDLLYQLAWYSIFISPTYHNLFMSKADEIDKGRNYPTYLFLKAATKAFGPNFLECIPLLMLFYEVARFRNDAGSENLAMVFAGAVAFSIGDFDFVDGTIETFFRTSPTMKDDPVFSFTMTNTMYRVAIARGDVKAMAEWREAFEPRERVARMFNFGTGMRECIDAWIAAMSGNFSSVLKLLEDCDNVLPRTDMGAQAMDIIESVPYIFILIADPTRSGVSAVRDEFKWQGAELKRLMNVMASLKAYTKLLGTVRHHVSSYWCVDILESMQQLLRGSERRAVQVARRKVRCGRRKELDGHLGTKGVYYGIIAKYAPSHSERSACAHISRDLFIKLKSPLYIKWLDA